MDLFENTNKIVIGMAQPLALPGSVRSEGMPLSLIEEKLLEEVALYDKYGYDSVILQNFHDIPVLRDSTTEAVAYMTRLGCAIKRNFPKMLLGILMVWDGCASLAVADACGADYVRVEHCYSGAEMTSTGLLQAQCPEILAMRRRLGSRMPLYADVFEPHAMPVLPKPIDEACASAVNECLADGLFVCGKTAEESLRYGVAVRKRLPNTPLLLGGGATGDNVFELLKYYDGVCIGTWIKDGSLFNPINPERVRIFMEQVNRAREWNEACRPS